MRIFVLDIGGSAVKHGVVEVSDGRGELVTTYPSVQISRSFEELSHVVLRLIGEGTARTEPAIGYVGICTTGSVGNDGIVIKAGHFDGYENVNWSDLIRSNYRHVHSVYTVNDGRSSTFAEFLGQRNSKSLGHFVIGTGIGGGLVINGRLVTGENGFAGYVGHMKVDLAARTLCSCGMTGCVETLAAAPAILRHYTEAGGSKVDDFASVVTAAQAGQKEALAAFSTAGRWLGTAISYVMNMADPGVITLGGGVVESSRRIGGGEGAGPFVESAIAAATSLAHRRVAHTTDIRVARYGNNSGLLGAGLVAWSGIAEGLSATGSSPS